MSDPVPLQHSRFKAPLRPQTSIQIFIGRDRVAPLVREFQRKISKDPRERGHNLCGNQRSSAVQFGVSRGPSEVLLALRGRVYQRDIMSEFELKTWPRCRDSDATALTQREVRNASRRWRGGLDDALRRHRREDNLTHWSILTQGVTAPKRLASSSASSPSSTLASSLGAKRTCLES